MTPVAAPVLGPLQRSMVLASLRAPASGIYLMQEICEMADIPDGNRLRQAWESIAARFAALRCSIVLDPLCLRLLAGCDVEWREVSGVGLEDFLREDRARGLDFGRGIPMRFALLRTSAETAAIVWTSHHALLDGRSYVNVWREWLRVYDALGSGAAPCSNPVAQSGVSLAPELAPADPASAADYWSALFEGVDQTTGYFVGRQRAPQGGEEAFAKAAASLSVEETTRVHAFAAECGVSVNNIVQGAWALLLSRYSGRREIVFGVTRAGRASSGEEGLAVGFFIHTVPTRVDIDDADVKTFLQEIRRRAFELRRFENTPLPDIALYSGLPAGTPPFESILVYEHRTPQQDLSRDTPGRRFRRVQRSDVPVTLAAYGSPQLILEVIFDARLYSRETMENAAAHLKILVLNLTASPGAPVRRIDMLTESERRRSEPNLAGPPDPCGFCAHELFERQAARAPQNWALDDGIRRISYQEINERANRMMRHLRASGVERGDRVALLMRPSAEAVTAMLATLKSGAAFVPLDPDWPEQRLQAMIGNARPKMVLRQPIADGVLSAHAAENPGIPVSAADAAYAVYTSGSSGTPKGVVLPHRALAHHSLAAARAFGIKEQDRRLQFASIGADVFVAEVFNYLCAGACLVLGWNRHGSIAEFWRFLEERRVTITGLPSAWWNEWVVSMGEGAPPLPSSLRAVIIGMEKANPASLRTWTRVIQGRLRLFNAYGPAETSPTATVYEAGSSSWEGAAFVPIGKPLGQTRAYVLDVDGNRLPDGVQGELYLGGPGVSLGYLDLPELTAERFVSDPFSDDRDARLYRTGDLAFSLPDGNLVFAGRADRQVKIRGFRVELEEIEAALETHPGVLQCAVTLAEKPYPRLMAFFVSREALEPPALRTFLSNTLPDHMMPASFVRMAALPRTIAGKIDRQALVAPEIDSPAQRPVPVTLTEKRLAALWEEVLETALVYATDHFFELGGDSLRATRLIAMIARHFGREIPLAAVWRDSTLSQMAAMLDDPGAESEIDAVVCLQPGGSRLPFFALPGADENPYYLWHLARSLGPDQPFYVLRDPRRLERRGVYTVEEAATGLIPHLKSVQPRGPYLLGGHCYGGILAYEMAQQLRARGESVAKILFFEVAAPGYPKVLPRWEHYLRAALALARNPGAALPEVRAHARVLQTLLARRLKAARRRGLIATGMKNAVRPMESSVHPNTAAGLAYSPRPIDCDVVQFLAADEAHSHRVLDDPRLAWRKFVCGQFTTCPTPGRADAMFHHPHVQKFAARVGEVLDSVNGTQANRWRN